jgi:hypothetical protein
MQSFHRVFLAGLVGGLCVATAAAAAPKLPQRNMTVELRVVAAGDAPTSVGTDTVVRTQPVQEQALEVQKVFVMNGEKAQVKLGRSMPLQWMESGQTLAVLVRWPGGKKLAVVEVEVDNTALTTQPGHKLPHQDRSRVASTVTMPLGEWYTVAVTGRREAVAQPGVYSTRPLDGDGPKWVQIRVLAP